jgi:hypothetical protein
MVEAKELKLGDACPNCGSEFKAARVPTPRERELATDRENPTPLPTECDTMSVADRAEHGALYRCTGCRYVTRFVEPAEAAAPAGKGKK